ncbi:uncharacterized protein LOC121803117 [Salvia splendens]|uniref:uncharacterized protein LOC121803117 n=1 Tax=Salvia splendens TaxID=180675 RepID=UPI001C2777AD|nr:uncharacterized protein LOC121803117 [Salvia splendens]XP_042058756.1 uncharacterized protein LOC121803117 [Salvia splendens]
MADHNAFQKVDAKEPIELLLLLEEILRNHRQNMLLVSMIITLARSKAHKRKRGRRGLSILAHHKKTRVVGHDFMCSSEIVSKYTHMVLRGVLTLHELLLVKHEPVGDDCTDSRWKWFKGCLGALDGTYIHVRVPIADTPCYRNRKGQVSTNTLAVCDRQLRFVYVLPRWEGSAGDSRVLCDAISRPLGLKVSKDCYYLCDNAYANSDRFITPYKGIRYHLKE